MADKAFDRRKRAPSAHHKKVGRPSNLTDADKRRILYCLKVSDEVTAQSLAKTYRTSTAAIQRLILENRSHQ